MKGGRLEWKQNRPNLTKAGLTETKTGLTGTKKGLNETKQASMEPSRRRWNKTGLIGTK